MKKLNYIFKLSKFKLKHNEDFITIVINNKIAYILITNNTNYNILVLRYQRLNKAIVSNIKKYYYILIKNRYLVNKSILFQKKLTITIALITILIL